MSSSKKPRHEQPIDRYVQIDSNLDLQSIDNSDFGQTEVNLRENTVQQVR